MEMYLFILSSSLLIGSCVAQQCDVAVIVVASVFGTLAVVCLVLGILGFLLWKRRKGLLAPKTNSTSKSTNIKGDSNLLNDGLPTPKREGHINPAFNDTGADLSAMEAGTGGFSDINSPDHKKSPPGKDVNQKTWTSLPSNDFASSGFNRQGSSGSLDDNYLVNMDPEVTSVWLQSQDFIGLGFNISGNMRDGIYVSHVHNRGPAIESNKVKVGDKILNVVISFENIVYEDALTILSYASPYPVKLTLLKEKLVITDKRSSLSNEVLSHPLYRSQSLDALQRVGKDSFKPKRTFSEIKPETRKDNSIKKELSSNCSELFENSDSRGSTPIRMSELKSNIKVSDIMIHKAEDSCITMDKNLNLKLSGTGNGKQEIDISSMTNTVGDISIDVTSEAKDKAGSFADGFSGRISPEADIDVSGQVTNKFTDNYIPSNIAAHVTDGISNKVTEVRVPVEQKATDEVDSVFKNPDEFASLMDKMLDMNQSSDEPFGTMEVKNISNGPIVVEDTFSASLISENQMSPPIKPTRRKKGSSTASNSSDEISLSQSYVNADLDTLSAQPVVQELMTAVKVKDIAAAPRSYGNGEVIEEDSMVSTRNIRDVNINSNKIELAEKEKAFITEEPPSPTLLTKILLDSMDNVKINQKSKPEGDPVEEEIIQAVKVNRDECAPPPLPKLRLNEADNKPGKRVGVNNNLNDIDDELIDEIIAMNSRPIELVGLPGRNTKEHVGGVSYDIQVADLDKIENKLRSEMGHEGPKLPTGGKAFEIREDLTGNMVNLELNKSHVIRRVSDAQIPQQSEVENIQMLRSGSLKDDKHNIENDLDWSGKRLIRSGSFSEIPQDNSVKDWTDQNKISNEDLTKLNSDNHKIIVPTKEDLILVKKEESLDLTNMSDISSSQSPSSTRSTSPITTNGPPELSPLALKRALDFTSSESYSSSSRTGSYSFTLTNKNDNDDGDAEC